jgi:hypothetical protein
MMCFGRRWILNKLWGVLTASVVLSALAWAQHPVGPVVHSPTAPVHVSPPPMYHPPMMPAAPMRPYAPPQYGIVRAPGAFGTSIVIPPVRPIHPIRPVLPIVLIYRPPFFFGDPFWRLNSCWSTNCDLFWPWTFGYSTISSPGPITYVAQVAEPPVYVYGGEREDFPQLYLKDGTILNVTDYWVVDDQLHFKVIEAIGQKPAEHTIPFEELDLQKTIDANTARGFRFVLRNAPYEQYLQDHPEGPPPTLAPPHP